jgi:hypothetical protein
LGGSDDGEAEEAEEDSGEAADAEQRAPAPDADAAGDGVEGADDANGEKKKKKQQKRKHKSGSRSSKVLPFDDAASDAETVAAPSFAPAPAADQAQAPPPVKPIARASTLSFTVPPANGRSSVLRASTIGAGMAPSARSSGIAMNVFANGSRASGVHVGGGAGLGHGVGGLQAQHGARGSALAVTTLSSPPSAGSGSSVFFQPGMTALRVPQAASFNSRGMEGGAGAGPRFPDSYASTASGSTNGHGHGGGGGSGGQPESASSGHDEADPDL